MRIERKCAPKTSIYVLSDIHYAGPTETRHYHGHHAPLSQNRLKEMAHSAYIRHIWIANAIGNNYLLDDFIARVQEPDYVVANGDYSCDMACIGVADDATCESAQTCLTKLRHHFGKTFVATIGDHELGKLSLYGKRGGMRVASLARAQTELGLKPFWQSQIGRYSLIGITSSLVALPAFAPDQLPQERQQWEEARRTHLAEITTFFNDLPPDQKVVIFCHDPTALPYLCALPPIAAKAKQIEITLIGHLHSKVIFWKSKLLAGIPAIRFLGYSAHRMASALNQARLWKHFNVSFCRSLAGIQLFKDGGYCRLLLDPTGQSPIEVEDHKLAWRKQRPPPQPGPLAQPSQSWQTKPDAVINTETIPT